MPDRRRRAKDLRGRGDDRPPSRSAAPASRRLFVEQLEQRQLLTALPLGAMPDDTGEYMLGDVRVTVVLMESDNTVDNGTITYTLPGASSPVTYPYTPQNWTQTAIDSVKAKVQEGLNWWSQTLDAIPNVPDGLLNFSIDWTYADTPVNTSYEPIARISDDYPLYVNQFVSKFQQQHPTLTLSGDLMSNIRAINNFQRVAAGTDWAFTIFVVNNAPDKPFTQFPNFGSFDKSFAFAGGRFMVVPASRPASSIAHETGHMFWAFDEYMDRDFVWNANTGQYDETAIPDEYLKRRGYYNTQNVNAADNPAPGFVQSNSIMSNGTQMSNAYAAHTSAASTLEMIGWKDSDGDGIFDVLDVPIDISGIGRYNSASGKYRFTGSASVGTLPNQNPSGLQNDISINQIRTIQASIDGGPWTTVLTLPPRTYQTNLDFEFDVPSGQHSVKLRATDSHTGVASADFIGTTTQPTSTAPPGVSGFIFRDDDADGVWDANEPALTDFALEVFDQDDQPLNLQRSVEPSLQPESTVLNTIHPEAIITAIGSDAQTNQVKARTSVQFSTAGKVFTSQSILQSRTVETWTTTSTEDRRLKVEFPNKAGTVSIRAYAANGGTSYGRLEAYDAQGVLLERFTSGPISGNGFVTMTVNRPTDDIAYVIARGHNGTEIILDTLQWGPLTSATSNTLGAYSLTNLPPGTYHVKADPPPNHVVTTPAGGFATVTIAAGQAVSGLNFGITVNSGIAYNANSPLNVNNDPANEITPIDALLVINWINAHANQPELPDDFNPILSGYVDVNNDGQCTPLDALLVINFLNLPTAPGGGGGGGGGSPEGELAFARAASGMHGGAAPVSPVDTSNAGSSVAASGIPPFALGQPAADGTSGRDLVRSSLGKDPARLPLPVSAPHPLRQLFLPPTAKKAELEEAIKAIASETAAEPLEEQAPGMPAQHRRNS